MWSFFYVGWFLAMPLGPSAWYLVRSTLTSGWYAGSVIACGIACADTVCMAFLLSTNALEMLSPVGLYRSVFCWCARGVGVWMIWDTLHFRCPEPAAQTCAHSLVYLGVYHLFVE